MHILGARDAGSSKRLADAHNQQSASQTGSSSSASSGLSTVQGGTGSGESGLHRTKGNVPSGSAASNIGGPQNVLTGSGAAEAKGVAHDKPGPGSVGPPDNASPWENKGLVIQLVDVKS